MENDSIIGLSILDKDSESHFKKSSLIFVGCQGWNYSDWVTKAAGETRLYPRGTKSGEMLEKYAEIFETIEVDSTFYAVPASSAVKGWFQKTPEDFKFSLKMPQEISHEYVLREGSFPLLDEFCESILILKQKLGVVLIQLPPTFGATKENARALREFLAHLPKELRFAIEFRDREWLVDWTYEQLEKFRVALCAVEGSWIPREMMFEAMRKQKTSFSYVRFMGERDLETFDRVVRPQDTALQIWKEEIKSWQASEHFIYFSNFYEGFAPESANKLRKLFGQTVIEANTLENQHSLF